MPRLPRLGHATTAQANGIRTPASRQPPLRTSKRPIAPSSNERAGKHYRSPATRPRTSTAVMQPFCGASRRHRPTAELMLQPANRPPPTPDSPNGTKTWSTSTADQTPTGTANSTGHSRSWKGPASAATTRCYCPTGSWGIPARSAKTWTQLRIMTKAEYAGLTQISLKDEPCLP